MLAAANVTNGFMNTDCIKRPRTKGTTVTTFLGSEFLCVLGGLCAS